MIKLIDLIDNDDNKKLMAQAEEEKHSTVKNVIKSQSQEEAKRHMRYAHA